MILDTLKKRTPDIFDSTAPLGIGSSQSDVLNDINGELVRLYRVVQHHLEEFVRQFKWALSSRQIFEWQKMTRPETLACHVLGINDLRFHDLRHEGASRLAEDGFTIPQIQQVTLHDSWSSLQIYVNMAEKKKQRLDFLHE